MTGEIWVLGATGRVGREAVERLQQAGAEVVVAGRNRERLTQVSPDARAVTGSLSPYLWMADTAWYDPELSKPDFIVMQAPSRPALAMWLIGWPLAARASRAAIKASATFS